jgi:hypothetical protein
VNNKRRENKSGYADSGKSTNKRNVKSANVNQAFSGVTRSIPAEEADTNTLKHQKFYFSGYKTRVTIVTYQKSSSNM